MLHVALHEMINDREKLKLTGLLLALGYYPLEHMDRECKEFVIEMVHVMKNSPAHKTYFEAIRNHSDLVSDYFRDMRNYKPTLVKQNLIHLEQYGSALKH